MIQATFIDKMGDDLTVVNAARVSFDKQSSWVQREEIIDYSGKEITYRYGKREFPAEYDYFEPYALKSFSESGRQLSELMLSLRDIRLLNFLAREKHLLPFRHPQVSIHIKAPLFVLRQLDKHQVGFSTSEISRRYVSTIPEFYQPKDWRGKPVDKKQGSDGVVKHSDHWVTEIDIYTSFVLKMYSDMLEDGVAPEMARMILPQNMVSEQIKTGSLLGWWHVVKMRTAPDAQYEIRVLAKQIEEIASKLFPESWGALKKHDS